MNADNVAERMVKHYINRLIRYYQTELERLIRRENEVSTTKTALSPFMDRPQSRLVLEAVKEELASLQNRRAFIQNQLVFLRNFHLLQSRKGEPYGDDDRTPRDDVGRGLASDDSPRGGGSGLNPRKGE